MSEILEENYDYRLGKCIQSTQLFYHESLNLNIWIKPGDNNNSKTLLIFHFITINMKIDRVFLYLP